MSHDQNDLSHFSMMDLFRMEADGQTQAMTDGLLALERGGGNASTVEAYISATYKIFTLKYNRSLSNFMGNLHSHGSQYFDLSASIDLTHGFSLVPHVGHQSIPGQVDNLGDYTDWSLTPRSRRSAGKRPA